MLKKLFSHTAIYGLGDQLSKVAHFLALPLITQDLTATDYGVSGIITAYTTAVSVFAALGLKVVLVNSFFKSPGHYKWLWRQVYGFLVLWNFVYAAILAMIIYFAVPEEAFHDRWLIVILNVAPLVLFGQTKNLGRTYYQMNQQPRQVAVRNIVFGISTVLLNVFFISYMKLGYMGWFWTNCIIGILTSLSYFYPVNFILKITPIFNFKWRLIRHSLKVSLPTIPHFYSGYLLNSSDRLVMDLLKVSTGDLGKYNVAYTVSGIMGSLGNASAMSVGPLLNKMYKAGNDEAAKKLVIILQIIFFVTSFGLCIWMKEVFAFLIRNETLAAMYPLGIIIVMSYNYRPMYFGANAKLMFAEKTNVLWRVTLVAGILNVLLNLILIPLFGFEMAAYTTFAALMYMGYAGFYYKVFKEINSVNYYPAFWIVLTVLLTVLAIYFVEYSLYLKLLISVVMALTGMFFIFKMNRSLKGLD